MNHLQLEKTTTLFLSWLQYMCPFCGMSNKYFQTMNISLCFNVYFRFVQIIICPWPWDRWGYPKLFINSYHEARVNSIENNILLVKTVFVKFYMKVASVFDSQSSFFYNLNYKVHLASSFSTLMPMVAHNSRFTNWNQ